MYGMTAQLVQTIERDGRTIDVYDNGMERDRERGRIVKPPTKHKITKPKPTSTDLEDKPDTAITSARTKVLKNGAILDLDRGRIVANPPGGGTTAITSANSAEYRRKRQEKAARLLREAISTTTAKKLLMSDKPAPVAAVAAAGGMIWGDVVLNELAYPRDRLDAWQRIGQHAEILADPRQQDAAQAPAQDMGAIVSAIVAIGRELDRRIAADKSNYRNHTEQVDNVIDAEPVDVEQDSTP